MPQSNSFTEVNKILIPKSDKDSIRTLNYRTVLMKKGTKRISSKPNTTKIVYYNQVGFTQGYKCNLILENQCNLLH